MSTIFFKIVALLLPKEVNNSKGLLDCQQVNTSKRKIQPLLLTCLSVTISVVTHLHTSYEVYIYFYICRLIYYYYRIPLFTGS